MTLKPKELEQQVRQVLDSRSSDRDCLTALETGPASHFGFPGLTWLWGPELYQRDRVLFRALLLAKFSHQTWAGGWRWSNTPWSARLQSWLEQADQDQDVELCQRLITWKLLAQAGFTYSKLSPLVRAELLRRTKHKPTSAQRRLEERKLDFWFQLDHITALQLYRQDPACSAYLLRHLPRPEKVFWKELFQLALGQDEAFAYKIYRALIPLSQWESEVKELCRSPLKASELLKELERRSPTYGYGEAFARVLYQILQERGRDAFAYVIPQLKRVWKPLLGRGNYGKMLELADAKGWDDLWCAILRTCASSKEFNTSLRKLAAQPGSPRLPGLSGVSSEWNFGAVGLARVQILDNDTALALYRANPDWLRGPFKLNLQVHPSQKGYTGLLQQLMDRGEEELVDLLASRYILSYQPLPEVQLLTDYYAALGDSRARRGANVLGKLPAYCIWNYPELIRKNRLARALYERSIADYAQDPLALSDLVEASEIHVMALGYRALSQAAPDEAARHLVLLLGCLFRPMQRLTRGYALAALERASQTNQGTAARILAAAREAQRLPDERYPKEALLSLLGSLLNRWPELRGPREQPVVYRREVSRV